MARPDSVPAISPSIALVGAPNCGKSTLFNALTGARQDVGNWPGVTVERKSGTYRTGTARIEVIDLPGTYGLSAADASHALDERIARDFLTSGEADVIVNILDASKLERGLYLTAQLLEFGRPMVVALNMTDVATRHGIKVDAEALARRLGCPVVPIVAARGTGLPDLKAAIEQVVRTEQRPDARVDYDPRIETALAALHDRVAGDCGDDARAVLLHAFDSGRVPDRIVSVKAREAVGATLAEFRADPGFDVESTIADARFGFAHDLAGATSRRVGKASRSVSDAIDKVVLHPWLALPIFLAAIYAMFMISINLGGAFIDFFDIAAATIFVEGTRALTTGLGAPEWLAVVMADGIGGGIQVVATFIPVIGALFLVLSLLEGSGYMARVAFLMDRYMRALGLPGKAFVPLVVGFGCNVPAIMATRTLEHERDRIMTVVMSPFMSCGARLAVYALFVAAFFPTGGQNVVFALYLIGIAVAVLTGLVLKHTLLRGEAMPFFIELPAYHMPTLRDLLLNTWSRLRAFVISAGRVIVAVVMALSVLSSLGTDGSFGNADTDRSMLSEVGRAIVPAFEPIGLTEDNWPAAVGIFTGVFAKEAVVGTLDALYSGLDASATEAAAVEAGAEPDAAGGFDLLGGLSEAWATIPENLGGLGDLVADPLGLGAATGGDPAAVAEDQGVGEGMFQAMASRFDGAVGAFAYLLFVLLYVPCAAAIGAAWREVGPRWTLFIVGWTTGVAYVAATLAYQAGTFARHPESSAVWIGGMLVFTAAVIGAMRLIGTHWPRAGAVLQPAE